MNGGPDMRDAQRHHWQTTFEANSHLYGTEPSAPGAYAVELFGRERVGHVLEPGAGQGRDTLAFLRAGLRVTALYHAPRAVSDLHQAAAAAGLADRLATLVHDVRETRCRCPPPVWTPPTVTCCSRWR